MIMVWHSDKKIKKRYLGGRLLKTEKHQWRTGDDERKGER
jgi:hypothetical protein